MADLNTYLLMYRSSPHSTTRKTPAEMLFGHNIRDRIPGIQQPMEVDEETVDRDKEEKEKGKVYADKRRGAKPNQIVEGDSVLVKRPTKQNKLVSNFDPEVFKGGQKIWRRYCCAVRRIRTEISPPRFSSSTGSESGERFQHTSR